MSLQDNMRIALLLSQHIKKQQISQKFMAEKMGISQSLLSRLISGDREPSLDTLKKLCKELKVSSDILLGLDK